MGLDDARAVQPSGFTEQNWYSSDGPRRARLYGTGSTTYLWDEHVVLRDWGISTALPAQPGGLLAAKIGADHRFSTPDMQGNVRQVTVLDADERVPTGLEPDLRRLIFEQGDEFAAVSLPLKSTFCGQWIQHCGWWPGYTRPQLLKKGKFRYGKRLQMCRFGGRAHPYGVARRGPVSSVGPPGRRVLPDRRPSAHLRLVPARAFLDLAGSEVLP